MEPQSPADQVQLLKIDTPTKSGDVQNPAVTRTTTSPGPDSASAADSSELNDKGPLNYTWMVKPCQTYKYEYRDCKSFADRFHQYWVEGQLRDCEQWKSDHENCIAWEERKDLEAVAKVIESEKSRIRKRLKAHIANDCWKDRQTPPSDWAKELPDHIKKEYEGSFLQLKSDEIKGDVIPEQEYVFTGVGCTIL